MTSFICQFDIYCPPVAWCERRGNELRIDDENRHRFVRRTVNIVSASDFRFLSTLSTSDL